MVFQTIGRYILGITLPCRWLYIFILKMFRFYGSLCQTHVCFLQTMKKRKPEINYFASCLTVTEVEQVALWVWFLGFFGLPALIERKTLVFNNVILAYSFANIINFLLTNICLTFLDTLLKITPSPLPIPLDVFPFPHNTLAVWLTIYFSCYYLSSLL